MSDPLVSIVIPCYNAERWVAEAIQSALDQTCPHKEVIVIDDGSNDGSLDVIKRFDGRIRWETGPNRGGCAARNRGLALAQGEWIQFLDADDMLTPSCLEDKLGVPSNPHIVVCCDVRMMNDSAGHSTPRFWARPSHTLESMLREATPQTAAPLHQRANLLAVGGFKDGLPRAQEFDLHLRLSALLDLTFVSNRKTGVLIRPTQGSVSRSAGSRMHLTHAEVLFEFADLLSSRGKSTDNLRDLISQRVMSLARKLWRMDKRSESLAIARRAQQLSPNWHKNTYQNVFAGALARVIGFEQFERLHGLWRVCLGRKPHHTETQH